MSAAERIAIAKAEMEHSIMVSVSKAVADFKAQTDATPASIDIEMVRWRTIGAPSALDAHVVNGVVTRIEL